jgi:uncharacterized Zn finger protein (UPF0148 family)
MEPTYKVILRQIAPGKDIQAIREAISDSFRLSPDKIDFILSRIPIVVKQHADYVTAQKIQKIMTDAGVECRLELEDAKINAPPVAVPTPPQSTETKKTCPKCGYQARQPNDPLLTAHQGQGECPACGVIVAKYVKAEQDSPETVAPVVANSDPAEEELSVFDRFFSALNFFPKPILIGLLLIVALIIYPWIKGKPPTEKPVTPTQTLKKIQTDEQPASPSHNNAPSPMKILPGETKSFTLFCCFPIMHEAIFLPSPSLDATYKVIKNTWQNAGVQIQVQHVSFASSSFNLWERKPKDSTQWHLISANQDVHITKFAGFTEITNPSEKTSEKISSFLNSLIDCNNPVWLKTLAEKSQDEITQLFNEDPGELKQNRYVMYELRLVLSISLPPGSEFGTREDLTWTTRDGQKVKSSQRSTEVIVSTDAVTIDYENSNIVISLHQWAGLNLIQKAKEEGVELILSTNVSNPWNIESS